MPPPAAKVKVEMSNPQVQNIMNNAVIEEQGDILWRANNRNWKHLRVARKNFVQAFLEKSGLTIKQFKDLPTKEERELIQDQIELAFSDNDNGFFKYTRDGNWMQKAVGEYSSWIRIEGMAHWHVRHALIALDKSPTTPPITSYQFPPESGSSSQAPPPPFDPVRDSVRDNTGNQ